MDKVYIFYDFVFRLARMADTRPPGVTEVEVFVNRPPIVVDLARSAPFGWWAAVVVALVAFIDRVEANLVAGALPAIQDHFGFGDTVAGAIPTAAAVAGVVLLLPAGRLADSGRRTSIVALVVLVWSVCSVLSGLATSFALFFVTRIVLGAAGQLYNPPASSLLADYYPSRTRGKAYGLERAGYYTGLPVGVALGGVLAEALGWRGVFFVVAVPGLLVALLVLTVKEPIRGIGDRLDLLRGGMATADDGHAVITGETGSVLRDALGLLEIRTLKGVVTGLSLLYLGLGGLFYWLPTFLERTQDLDYDAAAGLAGGVGGTGIVLGIILGSRIGDRGHGTRPGHRIRTAWSFLLLGAVALTVVVTLPTLPVILTAIALVVRRVRRCDPQPHRGVGRRRAGEATRHGLRPAAVPADPRRCGRTAPDRRRLRPGRLAGLGDARAAAPAVHLPVRAASYRRLLRGGRGRCSARIATAASPRRSGVSLAARSAPRGPAPAPRGSRQRHRRGGCRHRTAQVPARS